MKALRMTQEELDGVRRRLGAATPGWKAPREPRHKPHKFGAQKTDGFDSKLEARRNQELELLEKTGAIRALQRQVQFILVDAQYDACGVLLELPACYVADFVYTDYVNTPDGELKVEDCKGYKSGTTYAQFVLKRKLMLARHGIRVLEIAKVAR